ncbi:MAG: helix-turn-helix domain-containing protein [Bacteroidota bacterium]
MNAINHYATLDAYCKAIQIATPKWPDFDIRTFEDNMKTVKHKMPPFKHEFYAIALKLSGGGFTKTGNYSTESLSATVFFNSPYQIIQWDIAPDWNGFYIIFSEEFYQLGQPKSQISTDFPFLLVDNTIPIALSKIEAIPFINTFRDMLSEHQKNDATSKTICHLGTQILLHKVARLFKDRGPKQALPRTHRDNDLALVSRFKTLVETSFYPDHTFEHGEPHKVQFYADQLHLHPNHLNAVVKRIASQSASEIIYKHMIALAKSKLQQTNKSVKEIAFDLYYNYPNHFANFFKRQVGSSPVEFRKSLK